MVPEIFRPIIAKLAERVALESAEAEAAFAAIMDGKASEAEIAAFLMGLHMKGETFTEIAAGARAMRARMTRVEAPPGAIDCCGTGGTGRATLNVSSAVAFVLAGGGVPVARHGNRGVSRPSGAADVLAALGVKISSDPALISRAIKEAGVGFMMAPNHHGAMKHVAATRAALGIRTIFNLLGPLSNPAGVKRQLVGVFAESWLDPMGRALSGLGTERAWVVHGEGLDELTTTGVSKVAELDERGRIRHFEVTPEDAGLPRADPSSLRGGTAAENAASLNAVLGGARGPYRDIVLLNAAACFMIAGKAENLKQGVELAAASIDSGKAGAALDKLIALTNAS
ncbi:MAG: anthranilate phosphoribosyltransferase [Alphaproteobacteria bacterium]